MRICRNPEKERDENRSVENGKFSNVRLVSGIVESVEIGGVKYPNRQAVTLTELDFEEGPLATALRLSIVDPEKEPLK